MYLWLAITIIILFIVYTTMSSFYKDMYGHNFIINLSTFFVGVAQIIFVITMIVANNIIIDESVLDVVDNIIHFTYSTENYRTVYNTASQFVWASFSLMVGAYILNVTKSNMFIAVVQLIMQSVVAFPIVMIIIIMYGKISDIFEERVLL